MADHHDRSDEGVDHATDEELAALNEFLRASSGGTPTTDAGSPGADQGDGPGPVDRAAFADLASRIEGELRRLAAWSAEPPSQEALDAGGAFGMNTMAYPQWLQWVLLPRLHEVSAGSLPVPPSSQTGVHAVREFDGWHESAGLQALLMDLDALVARSH